MKEQVKVKMSKSNGEKCCKKKSKELARRITRLAEDNMFVMYCSET